MEERIKRKKPKIVAEVGTMHYDWSKNIHPPPTADKIPIT
jgi:hypothetical protein